MTEGAFRPHHAMTNRRSVCRQTSKRATYALCLYLLLAGGCTLELRWPTNLKMEMNTNQPATEETQTQE